MMSGDAHGGMKLADSLVDAIERLALLYAGTPDDKARRHLASYVDAIRPAFVEAVDAERATIILAAFESATMTEKARLETAGIASA